ncbi:MAG: histidinol-phosphate transaminase [Candidatus Izemoplasmataceae bacterium]
MQTKEAIKKLNPYRPQTTRPTIKLDANESDNFLFSEGLKLDEVALNLYPDSEANALKERLAEVSGVPSDAILIGSGSSELIELVIKTYMNPGDTVLSLEPTFGLYEIYTTIHGGHYQSVPVDDAFELDMDRFIEEAEKLDPAIIILCSPNNPTGKLIDQDAIRRLLKKTDALVLLDEAYIDFAGEGESMKREVLEYPNLLVARTFSKAYGMAGARLGYMFADKTVAENLRAVKTPYSVNALSQALGVKALEDPDKVNAHCEAVADRREALKNSLRDLGLKTLDSATNFLYVLSEDDRLREKLLDYGIAIRAYKGTTPASYRITVGSEFENRLLIHTLKEVLE